MADQLVQCDAFQQDAFQNDCAGTAVDIWWQRARQARKGTVYFVTDDMRRSKRQLFRRFSRPNGT